MFKATREMALPSGSNGRGKIFGWAFSIATASFLAGFILGCGPAHTEKTTSAAPLKTVSTKAEPADNSYCYVCHVNYQEEPLARQHQVAGVGCEQCHGMSAKHSADEDNLTAPDRMYSESKVAPFCLACHPQNKIAGDTNHPSIFTAGAPPQRCTDCHGEHRMKNRTRRWDKDTGKLIWKDSGPVMDRKS